MPSVLLATCADLPAGDEDADRLGRALERLGIDSRWAVWTDPHTNWDEALVVLRSPWDYTEAREQFLEWLRGLPRVANDAEVVAWNTDKIYLRDLAAAGVPTVPTTVAAPGTPIEVPDVEFVVKPSIGAGSRGVGRFAPDRADDARRHAGTLHAAGQSVLVQPYLGAVDEAGETSLVYLDGRFSHAIRKAPMLAAAVIHPLHNPDLYVEERIRARTPSAEELAVGTLVLDFVRERFGADQLYTRVDLLPSPAGPMLVELELTEPSLFLGYGSDEDVDAPSDRFAAAIATRA